MYPEDLKYTAEHEWVKAGESPARVGITDFAQDALGDIVYVQLPEVGTTVRAGDPCGELESTTDPYGEGWLLDIDVEDQEEVEALMDADTYQGQLDQN